MTTATDARARRSQEALRCALLRLLEQKPLDHITIRDIAAEAGVGYTTFFRHHPSKEALLNDLAAEEVDRLVDLAVPVLDAADTAAACAALCAYVEEHRALWSTLLTGGAAGAMRQEFLRRSEKVALTRTPPNSWLPAELGIILSVSSIVELLAWWLRQPEPLPAHEVARILDRVVISPTINSLSEKMS